MDKNSTLRVALAIATALALNGCAFTDPMDVLSDYGPQYQQIRTLFERNFAGKEADRLIAVIYEHPENAKVLRRKFNVKYKRVLNKAAEEREYKRYMDTIRTSDGITAYGNNGFMEFPGYCSIKGTMDSDDNMRFIYAGRKIKTGTGDDFFYLGYCYEVKILMENYVAHDGNVLSIEGVNAITKDAYSEAREWLERKIKKEGKNLTDEQKKSLLERPIEIHAILTTPEIRVGKTNIRHAHPRWNQKALQFMKSIGHDAYNPEDGDYAMIETQVDSVNGFMLKLQDWDDEEFAGDWFVTQ